MRIQEVYVRVQTLFCFILRKGPTMQPWLACNSLCRPACLKLPPELGLKVFATMPRESTNSYFNLVCYFKFWPMNQNIKDVILAWQCSFSDSTFRILKMQIGHGMCDGGNGKDRCQSPTFMLQEYLIGIGNARKYLWTESVLTQHFVKPGV